MFLDFLAAVGVVIPPAARTMLEVWSGTMIMGGKLIFVFVMSINRNKWVNRTYDVLFV